MTRTDLRGSRLVVGLYGLLVAVAGGLGVLFALVVESPRPPAYLALVSLPPTPLGFAVYGVLTVATVLGVPLLLVVVASSRVDDAAVE